MGYPSGSPSPRKTQVSEPYSDPLGGLQPRSGGTAVPAGTPRTSVATTTQTRALPGGPPRRKLEVDAARERAIHDALLADRAGADWERTRLLFAVTGVCALIVSRKLDLDGMETIITMLVCTPFVALAGWALKQLGAFLPAFNERMMSSVIVAIVVGTGAFYIFFEQGTMGQLYEGGHPQARGHRSRER